MPNKLVLTFDVGTQSTRAMLVDKKGRLEDVCQYSYETQYFSKQNGWAEQHPDFYFEAICRVSKEICKRNEEKLRDVIAVTLTVIRDSVLCLDENNRALRDIILWLDERQAKNDEPFGLLKKGIFKLVKMEETVKNQARNSVCNWIMENEPEIWKKTKKFVMLPTYLNYKLTGHLCDSAANMVGHVPFDYKNRRWMTKNDLTRCVCNVPPEKLCELVPSGTTIGTIKKEVSELTGIPEGLPLIATGSDKGCETLGLSVLRDNQAAVSFGTTATVQMMVKDYFEPQKFLPSYPAVPNDMYNPEFQVYRGFWMVSWFVKEFAEEEKKEAAEKGWSVERVLDSHLSDVPPGCDGLVLQPYWTPGIANPLAKGAMIGFSDVHTRRHFYRAIIEGIDLALLDGIKMMEKRSGKKVTEIFVGGGGSKSPAVCQILSNVTGLPVKCIQTHEACGLGSSMVAFVAKGEFKNYEEATENMVQVKKTFEPDMNEHKLYSRIYKNVYSRMYPKLEPVYKKLRKVYRQISK
ncbi:MAG: FGGY-family carbohydrate kinase [Clostridia bacterium]|nr:FGGY-family carbohydrate kinase [Clostridia bacterium]